MRLPDSMEHLLRHWSDTGVVLGSAGDYIIRLLEVFVMDVV
jgi:hypothetical protein